MAKRERMTAGKALMTTQPLYMLNSDESERVREAIASKIERLLARERNKAAWDVKLNQPAESGYEWVATKYGPRPNRRMKR